MASEMVLELTDDTFAETIKSSETPVLVDFWAPWCGPCLRMAPIIDEVAKEYEGKIQVAKVDIDDHQQTASKYGVMSIPTLVLFKNGEVADRLVGAVPKDKLEEVIGGVL